MANSHTRTARHSPREDNTVDTARTRNSSRATVLLPEDSINIPLLPANTPLPRASILPLLPVATTLSTLVATAASRNTAVSLSTVLDREPTLITAVITLNTKLPA